MTGKPTYDLTLIFPPQWSPFRPPLGVASLVAWLRGKGHRVSAKDSNIAFYGYLFSPAAATLIKEEIRGARKSTIDSSALSSIFDRQCDFAADLSQLRPDPSLHKERLTESEFITRIAIATKS